MVDLEAVDDAYKAQSMEYNAPTKSLVIFEKCTLSKGGNLQFL